VGQEANGVDCRFLFDLKEKIPYHSMGKEEREEIWDDGLHFTAKGYERMGRMVGEKVLEILKEDEGKK
jgi:lysophospholipase L1-like esterase